MAQDQFAHLKNMTVDFKTGKDVRDTEMLEGGAKDSPVMNETNETKQYKTAALPKKDLGGENNLNG